MIAHKQKKTKKKRVLSSGQLSTDVITPEMGLKSISSNSIFDPDYIKELVNDIRKFSHMLLYLKEAILSGLSTVFSWHSYWIVGKILNASLASGKCLHSDSSRVFCFSYLMAFPPTDVWHLMFDVTM